MITTKTVPPRYRRKLVDRARLIDRLNEEAYHSLIFIKAASGFGKTSLLTQWRQSLVTQGCKVGWINLDASDNEESQFLTYWIAALQQAGCDFGQGALAVYRRGETNAISSFVTALINDLSTLDAEIYLVLEDYHYIVNQDIHDMIERVLDYAPTNFHLVISSRTGLPFPHHQLRVHDRITEIGVKSLRFTFDETHALLAERVSDQVEPEQSRTLHDATEGWVAGIQMLSMAWRADGNTHGTQSALAVAHSHLSESILQSTFERLPPETADLLVQMSIFDRFAAPLCEAVIGVSHVDEVLEKLASDGVLLVPLDHEDNWYRFHPLFAEYLRRQLVKRVVEHLGGLHAKASDFLEDPESINSPQFSSFLRICRSTLALVDLPALHLKASVWFEKQGYLIEAVQHALSAGENTYAHDLIERCAMTAVEQGNLNNVLAWVANVPAELLATRWRLRLAKFWALALSNDLTGSQTELDGLSAGVSLPGGITPFEFAVCRSALACISEHSNVALELDAMTMPSGDVFHNTVACNVLSYAYGYAGQFEKVKAFQTLFRENLKKTKWTIALSYDRSFLARQFMMQGDFATAISGLRDALALAEEKFGRRSTPACAVASYLAEVLYETNSLAEAESLLAGRLDVMNQLLFFESVVQAYLTGAKLRFIRGDMDAACDLLDQLKTYGASKGLVRPIAASLGERIRMALLQGDQLTALLLQQQLEGLAIPYGAEPKWATLGNAMEMPLIARLSRVRCAIASDDADSALALLDSLAGTPVIACRHGIMVCIQLLRAMALDRQGNTEKAAMAMCDAVRLSIRSGMVRSFTDEGHACQTLLVSARARLAAEEPGNGVLDKHFGTILAAFNTNKQACREMSPRREEDYANTGPNRLSTRECDVLKLLAQGMPNKRIAATMNVSIDTVKWHLKNIFGKLDVVDRVDAVDKARRTGIIAH
ncbi:LuxR C-terminal-related transcriptional regulator [Noviherbaspirillum sedimenti]|nr:LuxR C-terminal-related transcriptional regulator [Noviherbaspirillum sedimenti]